MTDMLVGATVVAVLVIVGWALFRAAIGLVLKVGVLAVLLGVAAWFLWPVVTGFDVAELKKAVAGAAGAAGVMVVGMVLLDDLFGPG